MILNASAENGALSSAASVFLLVFVDALHRRTVGRRRQQLDHAVEHGLHALVLERRAAEHGHDLDAQGALAQAGDDLRLAQLAFVEVLVHQLFIGFGRGLDHEVARLFGLRLEVGRDVAVLELGALRRDVPMDRLHLQQVDHALEAVLGADRHLHRHRIRAQARLQLLDDLVEVGAGAVHLVDERHARHRVLVGLAPHGLGLRLHAADGAQHEHRAVEHAQRTLDFDGEVDVPGGVDDVEAVLGHRLVHALPERGGRGGGDGDAALLLLLHPVHGRGAVVHFTDLVADAGVEQDALGRGGLAGVDVGHDAEVAVTLDGSGTGHDESLFVSAETEWNRSSGWPMAALRRPSVSCRTGPALARVAAPAGFSGPAPT
jgi:hypothetical protein